MEKVMPPNLFDGVAGKLDEYAVSLDPPNNFDSRDAADFFFQQGQLCGRHVPRH
jgi:hypothetical protein